MKATKQKHGKENTIGKIIYGFLLFMPLLAIGVTCAYAIFNKNAYQSYSDENVQSIRNVNLASGISAGIDYQISYRNNIGTTNAKIQYDNISIDWTDYGGNANYDYDRFYIQVTSTNTTIYLYVGDGAPTTTLTNVWGYTLNSFTFHSVANQNISTEAPIYLKIIILETEKLDNVFYYSIDKVEQSPLFNWANNTATHNVLQNTCNTLGITSTFIPMLLAYWLMISLMYLLYDIALLVVHMAHNRIHDIESSI